VLARQRQQALRCALHVASQPQHGQLLVLQASAAVQPGSFLVAPRLLLLRLLLDWHLQENLVQDLMMGFPHMGYYLIRRHPQHR
jgi:hypothetical protein